ncbi:hypothetical protein ACJJTC_018000 [Scirpophaga incertulas]
MVIEADPIAGKRSEDRVHGPALRTRAGGDVRPPERAVSSLDLAMQYAAPSNLVLTPAPECRKLSRGISRATDNEGLVWALRSNTEPENSTLSSDHIMLLPDISVYPPDFRKFIEKDLLETATLVTLESAGILNWWCGGRVPGAPRLLPLATSGDGNCLPHAASLAAYGFHDRLLALRTKVQALLSGEGGEALTNAIKRRWRWSESMCLRSAGLTPTEAEWEREWCDAVRAASAEPRPRPNGAAAPHYDGLEQLHVLALAHVMRRPVVVFADVALRVRTHCPSTPHYDGLEQLHVLALAHVMRRPVVVFADVALRVRAHCPSTPHYDGLEQLHVLALAHVMRRPVVVFADVALRVRTHCPSTPHYDGLEQLHVLALAHVMRRPVVVFADVALRVRTHCPSTPHYDGLEQLHVLALAHVMRRPVVVFADVALRVRAHCPSTPHYDGLEQLHVLALAHVMRRPVVVFADVALRVRTHCPSTPHYDGLEQLHVLALAHVMRRPVVVFADVALRVRAHCPSTPHYDGLEQLHVLALAHVMRRPVVVFADVALRVRTHCPSTPHYDGLEQLHVLALAHVMRRPVVVFADVALRVRTHCPSTPHYDGLEQLHVLALAHVMRRPVVVFADVALRVRTHCPSTPHYDGLEQLHVLALAHVMRRPVVVFADVALRVRTHCPSTPHYDGLEQLHVLALAHVMRRPVVVFADVALRVRAHCPSTPHYDGLEQLHVLALAHVMRRPVVVFADVALRDPMGEAIAPNPFGGVYLPLEAAAGTCVRAPILLAYDAGHFSALAPCEPLPAAGARVPLCDRHGRPLPMRYVCTSVLCGGHVRARAHPAGVRRGALLGAGAVRAAAGRGRARAAVRPPRPPAAHAVRLYVCTVRRARACARPSCWRTTRGTSRRWRRASRCRPRARACRCATATAARCPCGTSVRLYCAAGTCVRAPILLAYDAGHFSALAPCEPLPAAGARVPLCDRHGRPLPMRYVCTSVLCGGHVRARAHPAGVRRGALLGAGAVRAAAGRGRARAAVRPPRPPAAHAVRLYVCTVRRARACARPSCWRTTRGTSRRWRRASRCRPRARACRCATATAARCPCGTSVRLYCAAGTCVRAPILLAYDAGHFSALAPCEPLPAAGARVPLCDRHGRPLPMRFAVDPGEDFLWDVEPDQRTINNLLPDEYQQTAMLTAYLDLETVECLSPSQPSEELRRSLDALSTKSSKQMNSVAKQFGSIGRSMSSKLKKNFGSMAKLTGKNSGSQSNPEESLPRRQSTYEIICCRVLAARTPVQEEMVKNYLNEAWMGYTAEKNRRESTSSAPRYGTGRSQFYAEAGGGAHATARSMAAKSNTLSDRTLYLSRSTFYDDRPPSPTSPASPAPRPCRAPLCLYYGSPANDNYCSRCARLN